MYVAVPNRNRKANRGRQPTEPLAFDLRVEQEKSTPRTTSGTNKHVLHNVEIINGMAARPH